MAENQNPKPGTQLVRLKPHDPTRSNFLKDLTHSGTKFVNGRWYRVSDAQAASLRKVRQIDGDPRTPRAFDPEHGAIRTEAERDAFLLDEKRRHIDEARERGEYDDPNAVVEAKSAADVRVLDELDGVTGPATPAPAPAARPATPPKPPRQRVEKAPEPRKAAEPPPPAAQAPATVARPAPTPAPVPSSPVPASPPSSPVAPPPPPAAPSSEPAADELDGVTGPATSTEPAAEPAGDGEPEDDDSFFDPDKADVGTRPANPRQASARERQKNRGRSTRPAAPGEDE
jgi:hypothetical protein